MMNVLRIEHLKDTEPPKFRVVRASDGRYSDPSVTITSPLGFPVEGRVTDLMADLRWYLERYLKFPLPPNDGVAARVLAALKSWGETAFNELFSEGRARDFYRSAIEKGLDSLFIQVSSDDPRILGWPWEALRDPGSGILSAQCQIERLLNQQHDPPDLPEGLPDDRVNILLVTARPYSKEGDVPYRSISRPLVELVHEQDLPASVTVLRPPTFDRLDEHLGERPNYYHIVHFDGHGGFGADVTSEMSRAEIFDAIEGRLIFENEKGEEDAISAEQLSTLLREHKIPAVVLNACRSAMIDDRATDPFASVAASMVRSGIRSVVARPIRSTSSGLRSSSPPSIADFFESGNVLQAARAGRRQMYRKRERITSKGKVELQDWLVPVVYQQDQGIDFGFAKQAEPVDRAALFEALPAEVHDETQTTKTMPHGFIGRDRAVLELERMLRRDPGGILIQGLGGVGKTTLAKGFLRWLAETEGLGLGAAWFDFREIRSAESVLSAIGKRVVSPNFDSLRKEQMIPALVPVLKRERFLIVWDNFEVVRGIEGTDRVGTLAREDQDLLRTFLEQLRGGKSKILITSRADEADWLGGTTHCQKIPLGGLHGEERWLYCETIVDDLGLTIERDDEELEKLLDLLGGHPLAMRVILPKLEGRSATQLAQALLKNIEDLNLSAQETRDLVTATLHLGMEVLPAELRPLLKPLALHEQYVDGDYLETMAKVVDKATWDRPKIDRFLTTLASAGLLRDTGQAVFEMHPALSGYLRAAHPPDPTPDGSLDPWTNAFVTFMATFADHLTPKPLHEQRSGFHWHEANFHTARDLACDAKQVQYHAAITQSLAAYAQNTHNFGLAETLFGELAEQSRQLNNEKYEAGALHQLGMIAQERRDFEQAESWYHKSLDINLKLNNLHGAASTYGAFGVVNLTQQRWVDAMGWFLKAVQGFLQAGDQYRAQVMLQAFPMLYLSASQDDRAKIEQMWNEAGLGLGPFPKPDDNPGNGEASPS